MGQTSDLLGGPAWCPPADLGEESIFFRIHAGEPLFGRAAAGGEPHPCLADPEQLIAEFGEWADADTTVVVFASHRVGTGPDGEALAVHGVTLETPSWAYFVHQVREEGERWS